MKAHPLIALACCLGHATASPTASTPVMRDVATHDSLARDLRVAEQADPMKNLAATTGEDPAAQNRPADLLDRSDMLTFNGLSTLVPKRAILVIPEKMKDRVAAGAGTRLVSWSEFLVANRAWITTEEVTYQQAAGAEGLPEETTDRIGKSTNLVVATYLGGPISFAGSAAVSASPELTH